jgi:hypothetical protein
VMTSFLGDPDGAVDQSFVARMALPTIVTP